MLCIMMLHNVLEEHSCVVLDYVLEEHSPQPHSCDNLRTQKYKEFNVALMFYFLLQ